MTFLVDLKMKAIGNVASSHGRFKGMTKRPIAVRTPTTPLRRSLEAPIAVPQGSRFLSVTAGIIPNEIMAGKRLIVYGGSSGRFMGDIAVRNNASSRERRERC